MRRNDFDASKKPLDVCSSKENGWQLLNASLLSSRLMKLAQLLVKLLDSPVSKGLGTTKLAAELLAAVARDRLDGGAESVLDASSIASTGGINSGIIGGERVSKSNDDPFHTSSCSMLESRSPCGSAAETAPSRELQDSNTTSTERNANGDVLPVYKENVPRRNLYSFFLFRTAWCDTGARCIISDSRSAFGWNSIIYVSSAV